MDRPLGVHPLAADAILDPLDERAVGEQEDVGVKDRRELVAQVLVGPAADALELALRMLKGAPEALDLHLDRALVQGETVDL